MKVSELISQLSKCNQDAKVLLVINEDPVPIDEVVNLKTEVAIVPFGDS